MGHSLFVTRTRENSNHPQPEHLFHLLFIQSKRLTWRQKIGFQEIYFSSKDLKHIHFFFTS